MCIHMDVASHAGDGLHGAGRAANDAGCEKSRVTVAGSLIGFHPALKIVVLKDNQCEHVFNTRL